MAASCLDFCSLTLPVWFLSCYVYSAGKSLFTGRLRVALVFLFLTIVSFISESLLSNTPVAMTIFPKVPVHLFIINYQKIIFWQFIFNFDVYCVSRKFITYSCLHICQIGLLTRFILSAVLWENGLIPNGSWWGNRVVLYNNCLPNNKLLSVKHILIVFG